MRLRSLRRPLVVGALILAAVLAVALWLRPDSYVAHPDTTDLPRARTDLAATALSDWLAARAAADGSALDVTDLSARVIAQNGAMHEDGTWTAKAALTWAYGGVDPSPASTEVTVRLRTTGDGVVVAGLSQPGRVPIWAAGPVTVTRTPSTLVVTGEGIDHQAYADWASTAVKVVHRVVTDWHGPLVLEVPATSAQLDDALGATAGTYANVAAITAAVDGSTRADAPVHVLVNRDVMATLDARSSRIVISHEATHAATGAVLTTARPLWLSEGFADYVALRDVDVPLRTSAGQIAKLVRSDGVPAALPDAADFDSSSPTFGAEYEAAWQVCVQLVADAGERALVRLYDEVGAGTALGTALRREVGYGVATLTSRWQHRLESLPGAGGQ
jgi:hypothetical protein